MRLMSVNVTTPCRVRSHIPCAGWKIPRGYTETFPQLVADPSAEMLEILQHMAAEVGVAHFPNQQQAIINRIDSRPGLAAIKCPTLIIGGHDDRLTPPDLSIEMFRRISDSELHIIRRCGHLAPLEARREVAYLLQNLWSRSEI